MDARNQPPQLSPTRNAALFRPRSVALFAEGGDTRDAEVIARNLAAGGFSGKLYACGVAAPGLEPVGAVGDLPEAPDLAVLCMPEPALATTAAELARRGCRAVIVPGQAPDLGRIAAGAGVRAMGPHSFGLCVPAIGLNASLTHLAPAPGRLALVSQSAATTRAVLDWAASEGLGFSHVVGIGGNANVGFATTLDWLAREPGTGAVLLDMRLIRNRRAFVSAARAVARTRPVVALRAGGRGADGGSGIGEAVMDAALRRAGVLRVAGLEDLLAAAETLARVRRTRSPDLRDGDRIALVGNGLGLGRIAADAVVKGGGRLARLDPEAGACLRLHMPDAAPAFNPLSLGAAAGTRLAEAAALFAAAPEVDAVVALHAPTPHGDDAAAAEAMVAAATAQRGRSAPVLVAWTGQETAAAQRRAMTAAGLAVFDTPEAAVRGALHLAQDRRNRAAAAELPPREVLDLKPDRASVRRILDGAMIDGRLALDEEESLAVLAAYGLPTVPCRRAAGPAEAADAAAMLRFPVVLKVLSPGLRHKSEVGGVVLGLNSARAVSEAAEAMLDRLRTARPDAPARGFLVQRQAAGRALELRLRLGDDPMFGPWIGFGQGGTTADIAGDEAYDLPPLNLALASQLIGRSRAAKLLAGYRDWPPADRAAVAQALVRLSQIAVDWPGIAACSINPLIADAEGVLALDASFTLRPPGETGVLAIPPYPAELARPFRTPAGEVLTVRPIRPEDAAAHAEAFRRIPPADVRWRFFSPIRELSPALVARLVQIDYDREMAFIATREATGETLGVARLIRDPDGDEAEFAIIVGDEVKGTGLGRFLMERLFEWAAEHGVRRIAGQVLSDNATMLAFVKKLGFALRRSEEEDGVMVAERDVAAA
ncbi:bifunctional acetate--CoA ligase family protein/GNAT family N-acetyltransferase [Craurococcus roseus]